MYLNSKIFFRRSSHASLIETLDVFKYACAALDPACVICLIETLDVFKSITPIKEMIMKESLIETLDVFK